MRHLLILTAMVLALGMSNTAYAQNVSKGDVQRLDLDQITLDSTVVTSTGAELNILDGVTATATEINQLDASALSFSTSVSGLLQTKSLSYTSAELNAGADVIAGVSGLKTYLHSVQIIPDVAVTTCTGIVLEEATSGNDLAQVFLDALGTADAIILGSAGGTIAYYSAGAGGSTATAGADIEIDNVGSSCAGADNYLVNVGFTQAP